MRRSREASLKSKRLTKQKTKDGPMAFRSAFPSALALSLLSLMLGVCVYYYKLWFIQSVVLAAVNENIESFIEIPCSKDYENDRKTFQGCAPVICGRGVHDNLISQEEARILLELAKRGLSHGGSNGGASILDLNSGALSHGDKFVNIYKVLNETSLFSRKEAQLYNDIRSRVLKHIVRTFKLESIPHPTYPTFFSQMKNVSAKTQHDEYWHEHVDRTTYPSFHFTSLLYLTNYDQDFQGGRFFFLGNNGTSQSIVEPKSARVSFFSSASENPHYVEKVSNGTRYALTIAFSCDQKFAIPNLEV